MGRVMVQEPPRLEEAVVSKVTVEEAVGVQQTRVETKKQLGSRDPHHTRVTGEDATTFRHHCSPQSPLSLMDLMTLGKWSSMHHFSIL